MVSNSPIIILGNPRSGTTLLRVMLNSHPRILIPPECGFFVWLYDDFKDINSRNVNELNDFLDRLKRTKKVETWNLNFGKLKNYLEQNIQKGSYSELITLIYVFFGLSNDISFDFWGDKNNFYIEYIPIILKIFPNCKILHIVRDGRDVASSYLELNGREINSKYKPKLPFRITNIATEWVNNNQIIGENIALVKTNQKLVVKFENLVTNTKVTLEEILDFLNLNFDKRILNYHNSKSLEPKEFLQWKERIISKPDYSRIGRYKNDLSKYQLKVFSTIAQKTLKEYNYV